MAVNDPCLTSIVDAAAAATGQQRLLFYIKEAFKLYSDECRRRNLLSLLGLNAALGPYDMMKAFAKEIISEETALALLDSAADQLGERLIYNTAQTWAAEAIEEITNNSDVKNTIAAAQNIQKAIFTVAGILMTGGNDFILEMLKAVGKKIIVKIDRKQELLQEMRDHIRKINNAIKLLETSSFLDEWKAEMLEARNHISIARNSFISVYSSLVRNRGFRYGTYTKGKTELEAADEILTPKKTEDGELSGKLDNQGAIWNGAYSALGVEVKEEQKNAVLAIPELAAELTDFLDEYIDITNSLNPLIRNYINGFYNLQKASGGKLTEWQARSLAYIIDQLGLAIEDMDQELTRERRTFAKGGFSIEGFKGAASETGYSLNAFKWWGYVKASLAALNTLQPESLEALDQSNIGLGLYNKSVNTITTTDRLTTLGGRVIMECPDSQEEIDDVLAIVGGIIVQAGKLYVNAQAVDNLVDIVTIADARLKLSQNLLSTIRADIEPFTVYETPLKEHVENMANMLDEMGYDRAKDLFLSGEYDKFFNMTEKTTTYVGAAMTCLRSGSKCAKNQQTKNEIDALLLILNRFQKNQQLEASRVINNGRERRISQILQRLRQCESQQGLANSLAEKEGCDLRDEFANLTSESVSSGETTRQQVQPKGGFDVNDIDKFLDQTGDRTDILDGENADFDTLINLPPDGSAIVGLQDRSVELAEINRNISEINRNLSDPPLDIELDQLNQNNLLKNALEQHGRKLIAAKDTLRGLGIDPNAVDAVNVVDGKVVGGYKNGRLAVQIDSFDATARRPNQKIILPGSQYGLTSN